ncbi:hypothetical protein [Streptomyces sp. NPDC057428]
MAVKPARQIRTCFTTGALGSCGATALNVASSLVGGLAGKMLSKYALR